MKWILIIWNFVIKYILNIKMGTVYILLFAIASAVATFVENDFGTSAAQKLIFKATWFELLLVLFGLAILQNIYQYRLIKQKKWASLLFHSSIIIILIGAGVTRYAGYEGMMHIREGKASNQFLSSDTYINIKVLHEGKSYSMSEPVLFASLGKNNFNEKYQLGKHLIELKLLEVIPNPVQEMEPDQNGKPVLKLVIAGANGREEYFVGYGEELKKGSLAIQFSEATKPGFVNIHYLRDSLFVVAEQDMSQMTMATQALDTLPAKLIAPLKTRSLYTIGNANFVVADFAAKAKLLNGSAEKKIKNESTVGLLFDVIINGKSQQINLMGRKGDLGEMTVLEEGPLQIGISYGSKILSVPFNIQLRDFILDRYPGTNNPSSYASEITLIDEAKGVNRDQRIYMNHILNYGGFRFFQSSYDPDEQGTYLSVNHDFWGTWISYIGYILLTLGLIWIFFQKNTRFDYLKNRLNGLHQMPKTLFLFIFFSGFLQVAKGADSDNTLPFYVNETHAKILGNTWVQDFQGRYKPFNTLSDEILRKLAKKDKLFGRSSEEIIMSMVVEPAEWEKANMIQIGTHPGILKLLGTSEKYTSYKQFFDEQGNYKLKEEVRKAQSMNPKDHGTMEKAVLKLDEKVNIVSMVFSGRIFRLFPIIGDKNNTWMSPAEVIDHSKDLSMPEFTANFFMQYLQALQQAKENNNWTGPDNLLKELGQFQHKEAGHILPSEARKKAELFLNQIQVFAKLRNVYGLLGILALCIFIFSVLQQPKWIHTVSKNIFYLMIAIFTVHTVGLALRWYVSGHAPWSNGYESMIYIAWTTVLAGLIFSKNSLGGLTATNVLAFIILLVAGMSWLDPEITPLVPVLKSYWLTIHVSLEAGSYGFLLLGAVIGMLNLLLMVMTRSHNVEKIKRSITELSIISEITVTAGLVMVSVGTYLGGVWANESWGRYWGWDAKETWALITILVYAFILHMRFIPGLKGAYTYNCATLFGFATVIMTYYGVNYYLSGLHSYAAGDPVPIPPVVYYTALVLAVLSLSAYFNYKKYFNRDFII